MCFLLQRLDVDECETHQLGEHAKPDSIRESKVSGGAVHTRDEGVYQGPWLVPATLIGRRPGDGDTSVRAFFITSHFGMYDATGDIDHDASAMGLAKFCFFKKTKALPSRFF